MPALRDYSPYGHHQTSEGFNPGCIGSSLREAEVGDTPHPAQQTSSSSHPSGKSSVLLHARRVEEDRRSMTHSTDVNSHSPSSASRPTTASRYPLTSTIQPTSSRPKIPVVQNHPPSSCRDRSMLAIPNPSDSPQEADAGPKEPLRVAAFGSHLLSATRIAQASPMSASPSRQSTHRSSATLVPRSHSSSGPQLVRSPESTPDPHLTARSTLSSSSPSKIRSAAFRSAPSRALPIKNAAASSSRRPSSPRPDNRPTIRRSCDSDTLQKSPTAVRREFLVPYSPSSQHHTFEAGQDRLEDMDQLRTESVPPIAALSHSGPFEDSESQPETSNMLQSARASTHAANAKKRRRSSTSTSSSTSDSHFEVVSDSHIPPRTLRSRGQNTSGNKSSLSIRKKIRLMKEENRKEPTPPPCFHFELPCHAFTVEDRTFLRDLFAHETQLPENQGVKLTFKEICQKAHEKASYFEIDPYCLDVTDLSTVSSPLCPLVV